MANTSPVKYTAAFTMRTDQEFIDAVDELRRLMSPIPTKSDAVRAAVLEKRDALRRKAEAQGRRR